LWGESGQPSGAVRAAEALRDCLRLGAVAAGSQSGDLEQPVLPLKEGREVLWNAFDELYRPQMRRMERKLLLSSLDESWKDHLLTMDHLRSGTGLRGMGQMDPKIEYKREGMKAFDAMWKGDDKAESDAEESKSDGGSIESKVTWGIFRMNESEGYREEAAARLSARWASGSATDPVPRPSL